MRLSVHALLGLLSCVTFSHGDVFDLAAIINTAQEVPAPTGVPTDAGGFASVQYDDVSKELSWNIAWQGLSGAPVGMHFHAPAPAGSTTGVVVDIGAASGLTSPSIGSMTVSDEVAAHVLGGQSYINIHTEANGPGEIRGQVDPANILLTATLDVAQEVPAPTGVSPDAGGLAHIAYNPTTNLLGWNIEWSNLTGPAVGMHFHGPAAVGEAAGVQLDIGSVSGLTSPSIGSAVIADELESQLLGGEWYINIHTEANPPGEIRGQVVPEARSTTLVMMALAGMLVIRRRRRAA